MRVRCVPVVATLSARGEQGLTVGMRRHVGRCERCAAELVGHRALETEMRALRSVTHAAPSEVYPRVMDGIGPWSVPMPAGHGPRRALVAALAAVATAAATAAAGVAVIMVRHRQRTA